MNAAFNEDDFLVYYLFPISKSSSAASGETIVRTSSVWSNINTVSSLLITKFVSQNKAKKRLLAEANLRRQDLPNRV